MISRAQIIVLGEHRQLRVTRIDGDIAFSIWLRSSASLDDLDFHETAKRWDVPMEKWPEIEAAVATLSREAA